ncbi:hypothetical protein SAMN05421690_101634 [Nitrosomonas sp. Nm51]|uniref:accessory factor UbiK family protein n=1 Tax=Nitrosomonas sp. Nm51 TaxID=133720 RepID=UPI0008D68700|nr:accessory factor UbiK family protein [Nitrosomonas sp. Nm51]SER28026.1 hypothetical protein SAMN05421690_101634 [Nitrosomonas sp. Nm51]
MLNKNVIEEINSKVSEILQNSPAKDVEKNMRAVLSGVFSRLDLVTREEFDVQHEVLLRTREKLIQLETKVKELEQQLGLPETENQATTEPETERNADTDPAQTAST